MEEESKRSHEEEVKERGGSMTMVIPKPLAVLQEVQEEDSLYEYKESL